MIECLADVSCIVMDVCIDTLLSFACAMSQITLQYVNDISSCCSLPYVWQVHIIFKTVRVHRCHITVALHRFPLVLGMCSFCFMCSQHCIFQSIFREAESNFFFFQLLNDCFLLWRYCRVVLRMTTTALQQITIFSVCSMVVQQVVLVVVSAISDGEVCRDDWRHVWCSLAASCELLAEEQICCVAVVYR